MYTEKFKVWCLDLDETQEDAKIIEAYNAEEAAEEWAEREDRTNGDHWVLKRVTILYVMDKEGVTRKYTVTGEQTIQYRASEIRS